MGVSRGLLTRRHSVLSLHACGLDPQNVPTGFGKPQEVYKCFPKLKLCRICPENVFFLMYLETINLTPAGEEK